MLTRCRKETYFAFGKFHQLALPISTDFTALEFADDTILYLAGGNVWDKGYVCTSLDNGNTWKITGELPGRVEALAFHAPTATLWACGQSGGIYYKKVTEPEWTTRSFDYQRWYRGVTVHPVHGKAFVVNGEGFRYGAVRRWTVGSTSADTLYSCPNELSDVFAINDSILLAAGYGYVVRSTDAGSSWQRLDIRGEFFKAIDFIDSQNGAMVAENGHIYLTVDGGANWQLTAKLDASLTDICYASTQHLYTCGLQGAVYRSENGGSAWQRAQDLPATNWLAIKALNGSIHLAGTDGNYMRAEE